MGPAAPRDAALKGGVVKAVAGVVVKRAAPKGRALKARVQRLSRPRDRVVKLADPGRRAQPPRAVKARRRVAAAARPVLAPRLGR